MSFSGDKFRTEGERKKLANATALTRARGVRRREEAGMKSAAAIDAQREELVKELKAVVDNIALEIIDDAVSEFEGNEPGENMRFVGQLNRGEYGTLGRQLSLLENDGELREPLKSVYAKVRSDVLHFAQVEVDEYPNGPDSETPMIVRIANDAKKSKIVVRREMVWVS